MSGKVYFKPIDSMFVLQRLHSAEILTCFSVSHSDLFGRGGNRLAGLSTYETSVTLLYDIHVYIMCECGHVCQRNPGTNCGETRFAPAPRAPHRPQRAPLEAPDLKNGLCYTHET